MKLIWNRNGNRDSIENAPETREEEILARIARIDCNLSPENLSCDGELSREEQAIRHRKLMAERIMLETELGYFVEGRY